MSTCKVSTGQFSKNFSDNMAGLGLDTPGHLFNGYYKALATGMTIAGALKTLGKRATMAEVIGGTTGFEKFMVVQALSASYYLGAVTGSIFVASGKAAICSGRSGRLHELMAFVGRNGLRFNGDTTIYHMHPETYGARRPSIHYRASAARPH